MGEGERAKGRRTYVYRLLVAHPPEAFKGGVPAFYSDGSPMLDWNWEPPGWDEDAANELGPDYDRFRWPVSAAASCRTRQPSNALPCWRSTGRR